MIVSICAITGSVFADDCNLVAGQEIEWALKNYIQNFSWYQTVIPAAGFNQALINLKAYCCSQNSPNPCTQAEKDKLPKTRYPESAYFFDHLVDVTMRRLDGIASLAYNLKLDPTGKERREYITEVAKNPSGAQGKTLEDQYKKYRSWHIGTTKNLSTVVKIYDKNNIETLSLTDKYNTLCEIIKNIYEDTGVDNRKIIWWYGDKNSFFNGCKNMIQERIKRENAYVKMLMIQKSNQLFDETTKAYTKKHFVEEKLMGLRNIIANVKDAFKTIVQQAPASKMCSK